MQVLAEVCALCSDSHIEAKQGVYKAVGQPTEAALLVLVEKLGVPDAAEQQEILQERRENQDAHPTGTCSYYASRWVGPLAYGMLPCSCGSACQQLS